MRIAGLFISLSILMSFCSEAQINLVPNNGFDINQGCPQLTGEGNFTPPWTSVANQGGTTDYMSSCAGMYGVGIPYNNLGFQFPFSGNAFSGLIAYYSGQEVREYLTVPLKCPLVKGETYKVGFHVNRANNFRYAVDRMGIHLSVGPLRGIDSQKADHLDVIPQIENDLGIIRDTANWIEIKGDYIADGGENYLTIGNFYSENETQVEIIDSNSFKFWAYYYIDEVYVISNTLMIKEEEETCPGDSLFLTVIGSEEVEWREKNYPNDVISYDTTVVVSPMLTTTYVISSSLDTIEYTVNVTVMDFDLGDDFELCTGEQAILDVFTTDASYLWQDSSTDSIYNVSDEGKYWVQLNVDECILSDTITVSMIECEIPEPFEEVGIKMPNVFTPNEDGINDELRPIYNRGTVSVKTTFYNRWGNKVYETKDPQIRWKADKLSSGIYYWMIEYVNIYGEEKKESGYLRLLK